MNLNANISSIRGGSVSADFGVGRGQQTSTPKKSFAQKLDGFSNDAARVSINVDLDRVHQQLKGATNVVQLCDLLDEYVLLVAMKARASLGTAPAGRILTAAINALGG